MTPPLIVGRPRFYQVALFIAWGETTETEAEVQKFLLENVTSSLALAGKVRGAGVQQISAIPGATPQ